MMRAEFSQSQRVTAAVASDFIDLSATPWRRITLSARDNIWTLVDAADFDWLSQHVWNVWHDGRSGWQWYAKRNVGPDRATVRMAREIMILRDPRAETFMASHPVDHINGQTLDNRFSANLRWLTKAENAANRRARGKAPSLESIVLQLMAAHGYAQPQEVPF
jgi:hypothetical protein